MPRVYPKALSYRRKPRFGNAAERVTVYRTMPPLPTPHETLEGCVWMPRFLAKARLLLADQLPPDYADRFGHPEGVDGNFFRFFGVTHEQMMDAFRRHPSDDAFATWFQTLPGVDAAHIAAWNDFAEKLGQPGYPMADRLAETLPKMQGRFDLSPIRSIFDLITADEAHS